MWLRLDGEGTLYRQVYRALRTEVLCGRLAPGERLPSSRALAEELRVARNTVLQALDQLIAEGCLETRGRSGTFVTESLPANRPVPRVGSRCAARATSPPSLSRFAARLEETVPASRAAWFRRSASVVDFRYGEPAYGDLPLSTWSRLIARRAGRLSVRGLSYPDVAGVAELREAIAGYLGRARGVACSPEQVLVTAGSQQAIDLAARLLVDPGDRVVLEEPHYFGFAWSLSTVGARLVPIPVDDRGLCTAELHRVRSARLVCVTPSHQFPRGGVLPLARRLELLDWARSRRAYALEDDYDSEFRFDVSPIASLQMLDESGHVIYVGTTSKLLFPSLRIGWMVLPEPLVDVFRKARAVTDAGSSALEQLALADFIAGGFLERYLRRTRRRHAERLEALLEALGRELGPRARVHGEASGLHVLLALEELPARKARMFREACRNRGVAVYSANPAYLDPPAHAEFLMGYGGLDAHAIRKGVRQIRRALDAVCRR
jgi:GntR family transcriptional regulator/MocR family aminotransferase